MRVKLRARVRVKRRVRGAGGRVVVDGGWELDILGEA